MLQRAFEPAANQPGIKRVVAVLNEHGAMSKAQERSACISEFGRSDQHRTVDVMALARIRIDWRAAIDQRVKESKRAGQLESLSAQLEHEKRCVACGLNVDGDKLGIVQECLRAELRRVDCDLLPLDRLRGAARFEEDRLHGDRLRAARRNCISSGVIALSRTTAAA
jgi:hypothetical protein